jgi:hypothetical protein
LRNSESNERLPSTTAAIVSYRDSYQFMSDAETEKRKRERADGRRQFLVHVSPDVIKDVKKAAVDDDTTASAVTEDALRAWLLARSKAQRGS